MKYYIIDIHMIKTQPKSKNFYVGLIKNIDKNYPDKSSYQVLEKPHLTDLTSAICRLFYLKHFLWDGEKLEEVFKIYIHE